MNTLSRVYTLSESMNVLVVVGGGRLVLARQIDLWRPIFAFVIDVPRELAGLGTLRTRCNHVRLLPLGLGETSDSLVADAPPDVRKVVATHAGMDATHGCAQARGIGYAAARKLLVSAEYAAATNELMDQILKAGKGRAWRLFIRIGRSGSGGSGSGAGSLIADDIARKVNSMLDLPVHVEDDVVGPIVHTGLGDRVYLNAAAATAERVAQIVGKDHSSHITRSLRLVEYIPCGTDQEERERYIAQDEQALASAQYQEMVNQPGSNNCLKGPLGSVQSRQVSYFESLPVALVRQEVIASHSAALESVLEHAVPDHGADLPIRVSVDREALPREAIETIASWAPSAPLGEVTAAVTRPGAAFSIKTTAELNTGDDVDLADIGTYYALRPESPSVAAERLRQLATFELRLQEEAEVLQEELEAQRSNVERARRRHRRKHGALCGGLSSLLPLKGRTEAFIGAAEDLRREHDEELELDATLDALARGYMAVRDEREQLQKHLRDIVETLRANVPKGIRDTADPHIVAKPLAEMWEDVWSVSQLSTKELQAVLSASVATVTAQGLAKVVDAADARIESVADQIARGEFAVEGPSWGGRLATEASTCVVLPPMGTEERVKLREALSTRLKGCDVLFADSAAAGVNVLHYALRHVDTPEQLFPGPMRHQLAKALTDPRAPLIFPFGTEFLDRLGMRLKDGQMEFGPMDFDGDEKD